MREGLPSTGMAEHSTLDTRQMSVISHIHSQAGGGGRHRHAGPLRGCNQEQGEQAEAVGEGFVVSRGQGGAWPHGRM